MREEKIITAYEMSDVEDLSGVIGELINHLGLELIEYTEYGNGPYYTFIKKQD